jgi:hypothetical protein
MLRVFFGLFTPYVATGDWWPGLQPTGLSDYSLPQFEWGGSTTLATKVIRPTKRNRVHYNNPTTYDEYIDLYHSVIDPQSAEFFAQFTNQAGITTPYPIAPATLNKAVDNQLEVDGEVAEWLGHTSLLSEPYPPTGDPVLLPEFYVINETLEANPLLAVNGYRSFAGCVDAAAVKGYCNDPCIVPYNNINTDTYRVMWKNPPSGVVTNITIYRAPVVVSEIEQKFLNWHQWSGWRLVHNHLPIHTIVPAGGVNTYESATGLDLSDETTYPYPAPTQTNWALFKPFNNAMARMNLSWQRRIITGYQPLIINTESMEYYKGYLTKRSTFFTTGVGAADDKAAQFALSITEAGYCLIDALTAPNTSANFTATVRTL